MGLFKELNKPFREIAHAFGLDPYRPQDPPPPAPPPAVPTTAQASDNVAAEQAADEARRRRLTGGMSGTVLTGGAGDTSVAPVQKKTLLGAG